MSTSSNFFGKNRFSKAYSIGFSGLNATILEIECQQSLQLPTFHVVGLSFQASRELMERVRSALLSCGHKLPSRKFTINLFPHHLQKHPHALDLPIALACLASEGKISAKKLEKLLIFGELGLDGTIKTVPSANNLTHLLEQQKFLGAILPFNNSNSLKEDHLFHGGGFHHLKEVLFFLENGGKGQKQKKRLTLEAENQFAVDFLDIQGLTSAKRALLISAAGEHHTFLMGPRGAGKSMLCSAFPSILPSFTALEKEEVATIYNFCGLAAPEFRPVRTPHFSITRRGLLGGITGTFLGELSLAHAGVLFLDEILEIDRFVLESLRIPLEKGEVHLARAHLQVQLPARVLLLAAANECPCGMKGLLRNQCRCTTREIRQYQKRFSHALLDRIDIRINLQEENLPKELNLSLTSQNMKEQAQKARNRMIARQGFPNGRLQGNNVFQCFGWTEKAKSFLSLSQQKYDLSERGLVGIARIALTIADLKGVEKVGEEEILEALHYRNAL